MGFTDSDAGLESAARRGLTIEQADAQMRMRTRAASTVEVRVDGPCVTAKVVDGHGSFPLEAVLEKAGNRLGWRLDWSEGDAGHDRTVGWAEVTDPTPVLLLVREQLLKRGAGRVVFAGGPAAEEEVSFQ